MSNTIIYGAQGAASAYQYRSSQTDDGGTAVPLRMTTAVWAPSGWRGDALIRIATIVVSTNVGVTLRVTPIVDGVKYDGTSGAPDSRVDFTLPTPLAGVRLVRRTMVGLKRPVVVAGITQTSVVGIRGTWWQFQLDSVGAITLPPGELNPDLRFDGVEFDAERLLPTEQVINAAD